MIYFIEAGKPELQSAKSLPKDAKEVQNWRTISSVEIYEIAANLQGKSILRVDKRPAKPTNKEAKNAD